MNNPMLAFVLGAGGARGALQVGALDVLFDAGLRPDLLVGTSIGAINAAYLAVHGTDHASLAGLNAGWRALSTARWLPGNGRRSAVHELLIHGRQHWMGHVREVLVAHGLEPRLRFGDLVGPRLLIMTTDLRHQTPTVFGLSPDDSLFEAVIASMAIPPWLGPVSSTGRILVDGAFVSSLPIEPALEAGATAIIALDLVEPPEAGAAELGAGSMVVHAFNTMLQRATRLEIALAAARGVPLLDIRLQPPFPVPIWDFRRTDELIGIGGHTARAVLGTQLAIRSRDDSLPVPVALPAGVCES